MQEYIVIKIDKQYIGNLKTKQAENHNNLISEENMSHKCGDI